MNTRGNAWRSTRHGQSGGGRHYRLGSGHCPLRGARAPAQRQRAEFNAYTIQDWLEKASIKTLYITPGRPQGEAKPTQNGHIESFHDKPRDDCINRELFGSLLEARVILEAWRVD
jgi:transposase InsO family protein